MERQPHVLIWTNPSTIFKSGTYVKLVKSVPMIAFMHSFKWLLEGIWDENGANEHGMDWPTKFMEILSNVLNLVPQSRHSPNGTAVAGPRFLRRGDILSDGR